MFVGLGSQKCLPAVCIPWNLASPVLTVYRPLQEATISQERQAAKFERDERPSLFTTPRLYVASLAARIQGFNVNPIQT